jgi:DNA ligase-1
MDSFAAACSTVAGTSSKNEKVRLVGEYLASLTVDNAARAALFFCARAFPRYEERVLNAGGSLIWQAVARILGKQPEDSHDLYRRHGDLGDMAAELLAAHQPEGPLSLADVESALHRLASTRGPEAKLGQIEALLRRATPPAARYLIKIVTGDLRIGLKESLVEEAIAAAYGRAIENVRRANMLTGDIAGTVRLAASGELASATLTLFRPIDCMLASPIESAEEAFQQITVDPMVEDKYDGIRAQAHKSGSIVRLYSRTLDEIGEFHELLPALAAVPGDYVLDGEIVGWRDGRSLPFTTLQQRLGRKQPDMWLPLEIPVCFLAFDVLYSNGQSLLDTPLVGRRKLLGLLLASADPSLILCSTTVAVESADALGQAFRDALGRGNEGIMVKDPRSLYTPGRRGRAWLKWKQPLATLDVVVTAVEYGHGKRRGLLSDYTFAVRDGDRLVNIGKAYSGLTDEEIRNYTAYFLEHTIEDRGFRRIVEPTVVLEVAFNNLQRSNRHDSGFALRFPRIVRIRTDKTPDEVDTLDRVRQVYESQSIPAT